MLRQFLLDIPGLSDSDKEFLKELQPSEIDEIIKDGPAPDLYGSANNIKKYDVFVFELLDGNISKKTKNGASEIQSTKKKEFTLTQSIDICKQLLEGLKQLEESGKCHNDLKPDNILFKTSDEKDENGDAKILIKISDFGTAGRSGGTPGWTWPRFLSERRPGQSDMYSVALLMLYVMCDSRHLFYRLRDNYIGLNEPWLAEFRADPLIELVMDMMSLKPTIQECLQRWKEMENEDFLMEIDLIDCYEVPRALLEIQDNLNKATLKVAKATNLDK